MIRILIILISLSACSTTSIIVPVEMPPAMYVGTVKRSSIIQCPAPVQIEVYKHLIRRDQYIQTLVDVIEAHNGNN
jgi:hypothetical protein